MINRTRRVLERITNPGLLHLAYCTGPAQLVYLLSALEVASVPLDSCTIYPFPGSAANDDLKKRVIEVSEYLGIAVLDPEVLPVYSLKQTLVHRFLARREVAFWYCRGVPFCSNALAHLQKSQPTLVFEYYDGYRSPIVSQLCSKSLFRLRGIRRPSRFIRQFIVRKLMTPDRYFMPNDSLWQQYAPCKVQASTFCIPLDVVRRKIKLVGGILDGLNSPGSHNTGSPGVVLVTGMFAERQRDVVMADELRMYEDILKTVRSVAKTVPILAKTHPRSSTEKMRRMETICARYNVYLYTGQQLFEYILEKSGRRDVVVIGPPTTALLNTLSLGYGTALCPAQQFMASYLGDNYTNGYLVAEDHTLMEMAGVTMLSNLPQLAELLEARKLKQRQWERQNL